MRVVRALLGVAAALAAGCTKDEPAMPSTCVDAGRGGYERALRAAPGDVRLDGTTRISECLRRVRNDAELQNLGLVLFQVADDLAIRARDGDDRRAAVALGYLVGAARSGAERSNGVSAELARRIERAGAKLDGESAAMLRAVGAGLAAGRRRG